MVRNHFCISQCGTYNTVVVGTWSTIYFSPYMQYKPHAKINTFETVACNLHEQVNTTRTRYTHSRGVCLQCVALGAPNANGIAPHYCCSYDDGELSLSNHGGRELVTFHTFLYPAPETTVQTHNVKSIFIEREENEQIILIYDTRCHMCSRIKCLTVGGQDRKKSDVLLRWLQK